MLTRRTLLTLPLAVGSAAWLVGCRDATVPSADPRQQADHDALLAAWGAEVQLQRRVAAEPARRVPTGAAEAVAAHVAALAASVGSPSPTPSVTASSAPPGGSLVVAARATAEAHLAAVPAVSGRVARLLASVAASDLALAEAAGGRLPAGPSAGQLPTSGTPGLVDAWQATLAAEHQAVYAYQVVTARLLAADSPDAAPAEAGLAAHEDRRDRAAAAVAGLGADPVTADAGYALPEPVDDPATAARLLVDVERGCSEATSALVAVSAAELRRLPADWLAGSARAEGRWSGTVPPLPGVEA